MTPQQLKNSILQMAMQGKLVEQRSEEGTGEELYQQIQKEKQKLIKEGKIKRQKSLPEITEDEVPFEIPESWKWVRLGGVISLLSGSDLTPDKYNSECRGIVYITGASCIDREHILVNRWTEYPNNIAHKGDILLTCKGTVGKTAILDIEQAHIARQIMAITPIICNADYLKIFLCGIVRSLQKKAKSMIPGIDRNSVLYAKLPLPPLAEQKRIVAKIEEIMPFIDRYAAAYDNLQSYNTRFPDDLKKSILQMAIQGKLVPQDPNDEPASVLLEKIAKEKQKLVKEGKIKKQKPLPPIKDEEIPFDIPESWEWVRLGEVIINIDTGKSKKCNESIPTDNQAGIIKVSAVTWGEFNEDESKTCISGDDWTEIYAIHEGDFLITRANTKQLVGACVIVKSIRKHLMLSDKTLRLQMPTNIEKKYLLYYMRSNLARNQIEKSATGTSNSMKNISQDAIRKIEIPLPPLTEQKRIVAKLDELLPQIDSLK